MRQGGEPQGVQVYVKASQRRIIAILIHYKCVFRRPFQISRSSEKANAAAVSNRFAESNAVKAVVPQQPRFLFLYGFGNAVFDLCQVEIGVLEVVPRE
mgnify:CR=1 FL=1